MFLVNVCIFRRPLFCCNLVHHIYIQHIGNGSSDIRFIIEAVTNTSSYKQYLYIQSIITHLKQYIMAIANDLRVFGIPIFAINE